MLGLRENTPHTGMRHPEGLTIAAPQDRETHTQEASWLTPRPLRSMIETDAEAKGLPSSQPLPIHRKARRGIIQPEGCSY